MMAVRVTLDYTNGTDTTSRRAWAREWECNRELPGLFESLSAWGRDYEDVCSFPEPSAEIEAKLRLVRATSPTAFVFEETRAPRDYQELDATAQCLRESTCLAGGEATDLEVWDWDACIESPPPARRRGAVKVRFRYVGRSKPRLPEDP